MLICAGGAYETVCSILEGYPMAARLNTLGYNAFVLSYRVNEVGLLPKPTEDVAAALRYIFAHAEELQVATENYAIAGFSAGGHLAGSWGTATLGYPRFALPAPKTIIMGYGAVSIKIKPGRFFFRAMFGDPVDPEMVTACDIAGNVTGDYPPTFFWQCKDDPLVPFASAERLDARLTEKGVPHRFVAFEKGGHGIGLGDNTEAAGWLNDAVRFWERQM
jgi:acetyl esterase/lipase